MLGNFQATSIILHVLLSARTIDGGGTRYRGTGVAVLVANAGELIRSFPLCALGLRLHWGEGESGALAGGWGWRFVGGWTRWESHIGYCGVIGVGRVCPKKQKIPSRSCVDFINSPKTVNKRLTAHIKKQKSI